MRRQVDGLAADGDRLLLEVDADRADVEHRLARRPPPGAAPRAGAPAAHRSRTAWSRSRRRRRRARRSSRPRRRPPRRRRSARRSSARSSRQTSVPLPSGSRRSSTTASGGRSAAAPSASSRGGGGLDLVARAAQVRRERAQELRLVVDDEDARAHAQSLGGEPQRAAQARTVHRSRAARRSACTPLTSGEAAGDREAETRAAVRPAARA